MKYKKGSFVTVPNKEILRGLPTTAQLLFMWLCSYADDDGVCFPSRETLSEDCCVTERSVTTHVNNLVKVGLITKTKRRRKGEYKYESNLYQIHILETTGNDCTRKPREMISQTTGNKRHKPRENKVPITQSSELNPITQSNSEQSSQIQSIMDMFYKINPSLNFGNKTERSACKFFLDGFGFKKTKRAVAYALSISGEQYAPVITTPYEMKIKLAKLKIYSQKNNINKHETVKI